MIDYLVAVGRGLTEHLELIIPTALTIYGWKLVYRDGNRLAKRNETFNLFQMAREILQKTLDESRTIWLSSGKTLAELDADRLSIYCAEFELCINHLKARYGELSVNNHDIIKLRRALTCVPYPLNNKEASNEERVKIINNIGSEISAKLMDSTMDNMHRLFN